MSFSGTASQIVAAFAANFDPSRLGEDHVVRCGRALADTMAVAIAAQNEAVVRRACDYVETLTPPLAGWLGRRQDGMANLLGRGQKSPVQRPALFNGLPAHPLHSDAPPPPI